MKFCWIFLLSVVGMGQTSPKTGHIVWGPEPGGYVCQPWGARCRVPTDKQIAAHKPKPKEPKWTPDSIIEQPNDSLILVPDPCDGVGCYTPAQKHCWKAADGVNETCEDPSGAITTTLVQPVKPSDITALMELIAPTEPKPTVEVEPITRSVLHCPDGWHVEVWHKEYCPTCVTFSVTSPFIIPQAHPAEYHPYLPPTPLMAADDDTDREHPAKCVDNIAKPKDEKAAAVAPSAEIPHEEYMPNFNFTAASDTWLGAGINTGSLTVGDDGGPCAWVGFNYDAKNNRCFMVVTFPAKNKLTCTQPKEDIGGQSLTCSFKAGKRQ